MRLNDDIPVNSALEKIAAVFKKYDPEVPFSYNFVDEESGFQAIKAGLMNPVKSLRSE